jgi:uncharacterized membrane protein YjfL (UPF0719 family)
MNSSIRWVFGVCVAASLIMIALALHLWGAAEIRADGGEVFWLTFVGAIWLMVATRLFAWFGLNFRDDAVERKNVAALVALCGALMAVAIIYAGGSIGEGPSYMNNVFSAGLGTVGLFMLWILLELGANVSMSIAEERDLASGLRMCGFLLATGLVLGRAVAGDWHSEAATLHDFVHDGWPAVILCVIALVVERFARPSRHRPFPPWPRYGLIPALFYLALAIAWLWHLGAWEGMPG